MTTRQKVALLIEKMEQGVRDQKRVAEEIIWSTEKEILDLNKQQLFKGETSEGKSIGEYKSERYAKFKALLNPNRVVDLFLRGGFYNRMFIRRVQLPIIEIDSTDPKRNELVKKYTDKIFGLNQESRKIYIRKVLGVRLTEWWRNLLRIQ